MALLLHLFLMLGLSAPQAQADTGFYGVAYVDVMPSAKATAITAFKQYRDASRKEAGYVRFEIFEQVGRPGHLCIIESFTNQKAFDAHQAAPQTKEWRTKMDSVRLSDYDQRPYKTLTVGSSPLAANDRYVFVVAHVDIGGQGTNAADLLRKLAEASRKDEGNLRFDVFQHAMRANHFTVIETWQNQKMLEAHAAAAHTRQYRDGLAPISGSPLDERLYKTVE